MKKIKKKVSIVLHNLRIDVDCIRRMFCTHVHVSLIHIPYEIISGMAICQNCGNTFNEGAVYREIP